VTSHTQGTLPVVDDVLRSTATPRQTIDAVAWSFDNGIDSTWHQVDSNPIEISDLGFSTVIHGTEGKLIAYGEGGGSAPGMNQPPAVVLYRDGKMQIIDEVNSDDRVWVSNNNYYYAAHQTALQHWVNSILLDKQVRYSGVDGRMELAATLAAIKSALEQRTLAPADVSANWTAY
jgi:predicted dehydrogenase